jgi:hypothetical protein
MKAHAVAYLTGVLSGVVLTVGSIMLLAVLAVAKDDDARGAKSPSQPTPQVLQQRLSKLPLPTD